MRTAARFAPLFSALACAGLFALLQAAPRAAAQTTDLQLSADAILVRAKAVYRARPVPPFIRYTLARVEQFDGLPDLSDTYTLRIWCRNGDRAAVSRTVWRGRVSGALHFVRPAFNEPIDPGPPTADLFEGSAVYGLGHSAPAPSPQPSAELPTIASFVVVRDDDYQASLAGTEGNAYHLRVRPRHNPERNRLRELWIDRATFAIRRAIVHDTLYSGIDRYPERFDIRLGNTQGVPVMERISMSSDPAFERRGLLEEGEYRFEDIAFPASLPAWYFDPKSYGAHAAEAPA